jgi:LPS export ABC transporter protein LptC
MMRIGILILILFLVGIISFFVIKKEVKKKEFISSEEVIPSELGLKEFHLIETIGGRPQWELFAKKCLVSKTKTSLEDIKCIFFSLKKDNEPILTIESKRGILDNETRDIELSARVKATTKEGTEFTTNTLRWRAKSGIFITPGAVKVIHGNVHIYGYGLEIDPERERVEIKEQVQIIIKKRL